VCAGARPAFRRRRRIRGIPDAGKDSFSHGVNGVNGFDLFTVDPVDPV
jgi:hypothetical protein